MKPQSRGVVIALSAVTIFSVQDAISKYMGTQYPAAMILMVRYWVVAAFVLVTALRTPGGITAVAATRRPWLQIARGALASTETLLITYTFAHVGLSQTHTILAATPLAVACLSLPLLGETVGWFRWMAIGAGFVGVLFIIDPAHLDLSRVALPVLCTLMYALYQALTRLAARTDSPQTSFFYLGVVGGLITSLIGPWFWTPMTRSGDLFLMAVLCVTGLTAHYLLIRAYDLLPAVVVQPLSYWQTVLTCLIGVLVYGEALTHQMVLGCAIVVAAGLCAILRDAIVAARRQAVKP